jgi:hypothetical protein
MAGKSVLEACSSDRASLPARCNKVWRDSARLGSHRTGKTW